MTSEDTHPKQFDGEIWEYVQSYLRPRAEKWSPEEQLDWEVNVEGGGDHRGASDWQVVKYAYLGQTVQIFVSRDCWERAIIPAQNPPSVCWEGGYLNEHSICARHVIVTRWKQEGTICVELGDCVITRSERSIEVQHLLE